MFYHFCETFLCIFDTQTPQRETPGISYPHIYSNENNVKTRSNLSKVTCGEFLQHRVKGPWERSHRKSACLQSPLLSLVTIKVNISWLQDLAFSFPATQPELAEEAARESSLTPLLLQHLYLFQRMAWQELSTNPSIPELSVDLSLWTLPTETGPQSCCHHQPPFCSPPIRFLTLAYPN